jgi:hypothetical protein
MIINVITLFYWNLKANHAVFFRICWILRIIYLKLQYPHPKLLILQHSSSCTQTITRINAPRMNSWCIQIMNLHGQDTRLHGLQFEFTDFDCAYQLRTSLTDFIDSNSLGRSSNSRMMCDNRIGISSFRNWKDFFSHFFCPESRTENMTAVSSTEILILIISNTIYN